MPASEPFKWRHFQSEIILLCVRWYLRYSLSYRDLEEIMLERGLETYIKVKGVWKYLYRAVDSKGNTLDFLLSAKRDAKAAKCFLRKVLNAPHTQSPRVITVDKNAAYPSAIDGLKADAALPETTETRQVKYLNNIVEQDHRFIKRRIKPGLGFGSFNTARRTLKGYEAMNMIRKGQIKDIDKEDVLGQISFINEIFGIAA